MIFTKRGFLGTKTIEYLYILSQLKKHLINPQELLKINREIDETRDIKEDVFLKAKKIKFLEKKKLIIKSKYAKLRVEYNRRTKKLEKTIIWKLFYISYFTANFIFEDCNYPLPLREIISNHGFRFRSINSKTGYEIVDEDPLNYESYLFESTKLCVAFLSGNEINLKFLCEFQKENENIPILNSIEEFSSPKSDWYQASIDFNKHLIKNGRATFLVRANGQAMFDSGITHQSLLVVDKFIKPEQNSLVIADVDGECVCRRLKLNPELSLVADNPDFPEIFNKNDQSFEVLGTVTSAINRFD